MYYEGKGVTKNYAEAFKWLKKAADKDEEKAFFLLGGMYYAGKGVTKNLDEAFKWLKKAADAGDTRAFYWLGHMYYEGEGVAKNYAEALPWLRKAVDAGEKKAMIDIVTIYEFGGFGVKQDIAVSKLWHKKAREAGVDSHDILMSGVDAFNSAMKEHMAQVEALDKEIKEDRERAEVITKNSVPESKAPISSEPAISPSAPENNDSKPAETEKSKGSCLGIIIGVSLGFAVGGPIGAVIGGWLGNKIFGK